MKELLRLLGVQVHNFTAAGDSRGMGGTESSNNAASEVIAEMGNLGTIKTKQDLCLALAQKCAQRNQLVRRHGLTAFEISHGRSARTVCDVLTQVPEVELREDLKLKDRDYVKHVMEQTAATTARMLEANTAQRDEASRRSAFTRDVHMASSRVTEFDLRDDDAVTHTNSKGNQLKCTMLAVTGYAGAVPITAKIRMPNGTEEYVRYDNLKPAGTPRATKPNSHSAKGSAVGNFIIFESDVYSEMTFCGGEIVSLTEEQGLYEVQLYSGSESCRPSMPSWQRERCKARSIKTCPTGYKAWTILVTEDMIEIVGKLLRPSHLLSEDTLAQLRSKGFMD